MTKDNAVDMAEIADLIEEAADTLKRLPDRERAILARVGQQWPTMLRRVWEDAPRERVAIRRPPPTAQQIDRLDEVLDWLLMLAKESRDFYRAVWLCCAERRPATYVAKLVGCHRLTVAIWRDNGLARIAAYRALPSLPARRLRQTLEQGMRHPRRNVA